MFAMDIIKQIFDIKGALLISIVFILLYFLQSKWPLRKKTQPVFKRMIINFLVSIPSFTLLRFLFLPLMVAFAIENQNLHFGLTYLFDANPYLESVLAFLMMDYTNYLWHILNHKIPFLWRFHVVHHCDPDLDISTALRFHFGELIGSVFFRGMFVFISGASPVQVLIYEVVFECATQFHHSNWKLPYRFEKILNLMIVTPRMHGIHHSIIREETESNYSVIFSLWDRLHKTIRLNVGQNIIMTGVPSYPDARELTVPYLLKMPFTKIRPWNKEALLRSQPHPENSRNKLRK